MSAELDILFINPSARGEVYQALGTDLTAIEPPIWAGLLATHCRNAGLQVDILDAEALGLDANGVAEVVAARAPLLSCLVVYGHQPSASTQTMTAAGKLLSAIREHAAGCRTAILGGHVSALPERTLREEEVDFVIQGEGAETLRVLAGVLRDGNSNDLRQVPGLWFSEEGQVVRNAPAALGRELDREFPGMAWDLLPMERYRAHNWHCLDDPEARQPYASMYTSLGCPYSCSFCCINAPFGKSGIRYFSPDLVISEIDLLVRRYRVRNLKIADEMFVLNKRHVSEICDRIIERGYDLNIWAYARIDTVKDGLLPKMKRAGINWLALGIESASEHVRDGAEKAFDQKEIFATVRKIQAAGIHVIGNYIFGLPDDDAESMQATLDLALDLRCEFANFYSAMAYPGSKLFTLAAEQGWPLPETWSGYSQHAVHSRPLPTAALTSAEVLQFRDYAFHRYFSDPGYLSHVERTFGASSREYLERIASHKLCREADSR